METIKEKIHRLNELVQAGKAFDAFEMYYHDEVIMQENETVPTIGKEANRKHEFFSGVKKILWR